ncbi:MAG: molybdenum cofactor guanylyltransferase [Candidatus Thiodiazotropha sp. (ex Lucina aurantia)]|uniref:Molybdenum cofactor guanylyltransferase n=2 Tax=Candidatus Thiodiazotropha TaxID=1913444 RepID=A0A7Z0VJ90_9GAMM|nr:molybdenum cofactor guanylyltransferase MobA [Candidatus Thiodiazotropha endolucinida]MBT3010097.1 molybdenum cofactor guanylyltransferase [Candidatus Thiodiazotropha sp. (ex Lucina pensylvanica)]MBT3022126.1 molybdenum cofactor guanylyltransferase [Candidatus Thiodiazotropha taylori]MBT3052709.1 molybdenum cofactor guanylyltransferase [Candidatus Thiodiazotropha sp. (ex Codakia orbicularis)]MBV2103376.1 molybdenum cofactor guanylyltransferase [Candidatus Thiodiazotropha sp. (ex Lucina auran
MSTQPAVTAVILAGGRGRRMGGEDKGLIELNGRPLVQHVISAIQPQVATILINANRNQERYAAFGYPVIADSLLDYQGPLAGFIAALQAVETEDMLTLPCDGPLVPPDLVARLYEARQSAGADIAVAHDGDRLQPVYALIPKRLADSLQRYLDRGDRKIDLWYEEHRVAHADFSDIPRTFINVNTLQERDNLQGSAA